MNTSLPAGAVAPLHADHPGHSTYPGGQSEGVAHGTCASLPTQLVDRMASRPYRMHNYLWHEVRTNWPTYPKTVQRKLRQAGWEPPRPAVDERGLPNATNDSGEDYLYMHRELILYANGILAEVGDPDYPRIEGWVELPPPGDPDFPVPPPWFDPQEFPVITEFIARSKSDVAFQKNLKSWEGTFTDPGFLSAVSLGTLGALIEHSLYPGVKRRWSAVPGGRRPDPGPTEAEAIPIEWDDPRYDYLADPYSMQVNPAYWKFYGWVDDRIEDWKLVNGVFGNGFWKASWVGKMPEAAEGAPSGLYERLEDSEVANQHAKEIEQMLMTIAGAGRADR
jgi:hypothetical protein